MLQGLHTTLGAANPLGLRGMPSPGLVSLLDIGPLGDVSRRIQVPVMSDVA